MCRWMGSHFHDWTDYNGVAHFLIFVVRQFSIFTVSKRTRVFVLQVKNKVFFIQHEKIHKQKVTRLVSRKLHVCPKVTKMRSIIGHRIDYNGVGALRSQRHIPSKSQPENPPPLPLGMMPQVEGALPHRSIWVCAAEQGMVLRVLSLKQGIRFHY